MDKLIDSVNGLDTTNLTIDSLNWKYGTGRSYTEKKGSEKVCRYRCGVMTDVGDIREDVWEELVLALIVRDNERMLYDHLYAWYKNELLLRFFTFVGIVAVFMLCIRAWLFFLICLFVQAVILIIWAIGRKKSKRYCESTEENETLVSSAAPVRPIAQQVTERVNELYPGAKWVWAEPDSTAKILNDGHAYILLNKAGGYGKACVICCDGKVEHIEMIGKTLAEQDTPEDKAVVAAPVREEQPAVNYELIAYEWVESHILELNARCNEALGEEEVAFLIPSTELPVRESWPEVCKELVRNGLKSAECAEEGIRINLSN